MFPVLTHERITLRELSVDDAPAVFKYASDPEVTRFMVWPRNERVEDSIPFLELAEQQAQEDPRAHYELGIVVDGELVGTVGLHKIDWQHRRGQMGYVLRRDMWGQGIATHVARMVLTFAFDELGLERVEATHDPDNVASARVMEKIGMKHEGLLRSYHDIHGERRDSVLRAILRTDPRI